MIWIFFEEMKKAYFIVIEFGGAILSDRWYHFGEINSSRAHLRFQIIPLGLQETTCHCATYKQNQLLILLPGLFKF